MTAKESAALHPRRPCSGSCPVVAALRAEIERLLPPAQRNPPSPTEPLADPDAIPGVGRSLPCDGDERRPYRQSGIMCSTGGCEDCDHPGCRDRLGGHEQIHRAAARQTK